MIIEKKLIGSIYTKETFYLESGIESILFTFEITKGYAYIFIKDSLGLTRVQYLNGKAPNKVLLGKELSSVGTYPGEIPEGQWDLLIISFNPSENHVSEETICRISLEKNMKVPIETLMLFDEAWTEYREGEFSSIYDFDKIHKDEKKWYSGDFHTHTRLSDGHMNLQEARDVIDNIQNLDFMFITDHNMVHTGFKKGNGLVIPGIEITTPLGHFNILGNKNDEFIPNRKELNLQYMEELMDLAKSQGAITSINHSMMNPWHWQFEDLSLEKIDTLEICCDPTFHSSQESTEKTLEFINHLWNDGHRIYGIGGSDSHLLPYEKYINSDMPSIYGDPRTYVYLDKLSPNSILEGVKNGQTYIARALRLEPSIIGEKLYKPGERVYERNLEYKLGLYNVFEEYIIKLVVNGETIETKNVKKDSIISFDINLEGDYSWARIDITNSKAHFEAYINPIFYGAKQTKLKTWKDVLGLMEGRIGN